MSSTFSQSLNSSALQVQLFAKYVVLKVELKQSYFFQSEWCHRPRHGAFVVLQSEKLD